MNAVQKPAQYKNQKKEDKPVSEYISEGCVYMCKAVL
jgi:hypothetical protein